MGSACDNHFPEPRAGLALTKTKTTKKK